MAHLTFDERKEKLLNINNIRARKKLIYEWTKTNIISFKEFLILINYVAYGNLYGLKAIPQN